MTTPPICDYEGSDYQTKFWEEGGRDYEDAVEAIALRRLLPKQGNLLLELGAGAGRNTPRYNNFQRVFLVDYSMTQLRQAQERLGKSVRFRFVAADIYHLPFVTGLFDTATMIRTLHHMADAPAALEQIANTMQTNGALILEYANKRNLKAILRYLTGKQTWNPFSHEPIEFADLNFDFHPASVSKWLKDCGFKIERQRTVSHFRMQILKRLTPLKLLVFMDKLFQPTGSFWQLTPSVFLRAIYKEDVARAINGDFFRCPACLYSPLMDSPPKLICPACGKTWPVVDGIYDFRMDK